jgi:carbon storage regulator
MLVLTRKSGEEIVVGGSIVFQIVQVGHNKVKVGVTAPQDTPIARRELLSIPPWCSPNGHCFGLVMDRVTDKQIEQCADCPCCNVEALPRSTVERPAKV